MLSSSFSTLRIPLLAALTFALSCAPNAQARRERVERLYEEGNRAFIEKRYSDAISAYDQVLKLMPDEIVVQMSKSGALRLRGVDAYNDAVKNTADPGLKESRIAGAKQDMERAALISTGIAKIARESVSLNLLQALSIDELKYQVLCGHAETMRVVATVVDVNRSEEAVAAIMECVELEPIAEAKTAWRLNANKLLLKSGKTDQALAGYKELLAENPESIEATLGVGLALSQSGDDKQFDEAKPYLKKFVERAPDSHPMKADVIQTLSYMK